MVEKIIIVEKDKKERKTKDTPQYIIDRMNEAHQEWKTTKQVKYNIDGKRLDETSQE